MKNLKFILLFFGCTLFLNAQDKSEDIEEFSELKIFNGLDVEIERSNQAKIEISGEKAEEVSIKYVKKVLKISVKLHDKFKPKDLKIKVYYNHDILILDANEGASIVSDIAIKQDNLTIKTQEGAFIQTPVDVNSLTIKVVSGSNIKVSGKADKQKVEVTTGGSYEAYDLATKNTEVVSASGGKAEIKVSGVLDAKVRFGGNIHYKGNPEKVNSKTIIGGNIKNKG